MRKKVHLYVLGLVCKIMAGFMLLPAIVALAYSEKRALFAFSISSVIFFVMGLIAARKKPNTESLVAQDGYIIAAEAWILVSVIGAVPIYLSGEIQGALNCLFESVSAFTTTGARIVENVEVLSHTLLFWCSLSHWIGGMGVLVFMLALVSMLGGKSIYIMRAESPGPIVDKLVPQMKQSASILYRIYIGLTVLLFLLLVIGKMPLFDSICNALGTASTGGFALKNTSMAYAGPYIQWIIGIFMVLFGINFNVYFLLFRRRLKEAVHNQELWIYLSIIVVVTTLIALDINKYYGSMADTIRNAFFHVSAMLTTTAYYTVNYNIWPEFSKTLLVLLMFVGGSAGSTAGGLKVARAVLLAKIAKREIVRLANPRTVDLITFNGKTVDESVVRSTANYFILYIALFVISVVALSSGDHELETSFTVVAACLNNVGIGLAEIAPGGNFQIFNAFEKTVLMANMLIGRLEIVPMFILFAPLFTHKSGKDKLKYKLEQRKTLRRKRKKTS